MNQGADTEAGVNTRGPQSKENEFAWKSLTLFLLTACAVLICLLMLRYLATGGDSATPVASDGSDRAWEAWGQ